MEDSSSSRPESLSADREKAIHQLIRGRELANQLRVILGKPFRDDDGLLAADDLIRNILASFTQTIAILNCSATDEVSQIPAKRRKFKDSGESSKASVLKDRRGTYKRRKSSQTLTRLAPTLIDDGHAWRKYGQKVILNAKHPRNYYRCSHKFEQGCQATKQVQTTEDDPPMYRTTYHGHHTCKKLIEYPHILLDSAPRDDSVLLSFASNNPHDSFLPSFPWLKLEYEEDHQKQSLCRKQSPEPYDYLLSPDLTALESSGPVPVLSSGSDHGDVISSSGVYSCTESTHSQSLDVDMMVGAVDFDDVFNLDF